MEPYRWNPDEAAVNRTTTKVSLLIPNHYRNRLAEAAQKQQKITFGEGDNICEISFVDKLPDTVPSR